MTVNSAEIAQMLGEPPYAVESIADRFVYFLPATRVGDRIMYPDEAVDTFRFIFDQLRVGVRYPHIDVLLAGRFPVSEMHVTGVSLHHARHNEMASVTAVAPAVAPDASRQQQQPQQPQALPVAPPSDTAASAGVRRDLDSLATRMDRLQSQFETLLERLSASTSMPGHTPGDSDASETRVRPGTPSVIDREHERADRAMQAPGETPAAIDFDELLTRSRNRLGTSNGR